MGFRRGKVSRFSRRKRRSVKRRTSFLLKGVEPAVATIESGGVATSGVGRCSYSVVLSPNAAYDYYALNQVSLAPNFPIFSSSGVTQKWFTKCWARTEIINQSLLPTNITFYTCVPRYNITRAMFSLTTQNQQDLGGFTGGSTGFLNPQIANFSTTASYTGFPSVLANSLAAYDYGVENAAAPYGLHQIPSITPFDSPVFTRLFKISSVQQACVNPGRCFTLSSVRPYKPFNSMIQQFGTQLSAHIAFKGEPIVIMKLQGGPVSDAGLPNNSTVANTKVSYVAQRKYSVKLLHNGTRSITTVYTLPTGFSSTPEFVTMPSTQVQTSAAAP